MTCAHAGHACRRCRPTEPAERTLRSLTSLFDHTPRCDSGSLTGPLLQQLQHSIAAELANAGRGASRRLASAGRPAQPESVRRRRPQRDLQAADDAEAAEAAEAYAAGLGGDAQWDFTQRYYNKGAEAARLQEARVAFLLNRTRENLRRDAWLADFEPLPSSCPLFARKVAAEAVPELARYAWHCDGLGFAWSCVAGAAR